MKYANVIVDISVGSLDRIYQYGIPEELLEQAVVGAAVLIPFGNGNRSMEGFIVSLSDSPSFDVNRTKQLLAVNEKGTIVESQLIVLAFWMKEQFGATMNDALRAVLPVKEKMRQQEEKTLHRAVPFEVLQKAASEAGQKKHSAKERLLNALLSEEHISYDTALKELKVSRAAIYKLIKDGLLKEESKKQFRNPFPTTAGKQEPFLLNREQQLAVFAVMEGIEKSAFFCYLLHGITGSGKTEVYLDVIQTVVKAGRQVIMLIPEIALTYQTMMRFYRRFGDRISVMHSRLSKGERHDQMQRAKQGDTDIMIGPRSALFTPFRDLGLIIIDEEHEGSYKNEGLPKYHTREVAIKRAELNNAVVLLGSATPSLESYTAALQGKYKLLTLKERAQHAVLPTVYVVDLREELKRKNKSIFSLCLQEKIKEKLNKQEQIILFLNRRGYAGFVSCRSCGLPMKCPHCDISLTYHREGALHCHYCGYREDMPSSCPVCGSPYIGTFGIGTQKIEELLHREFEYAKVLRMDGDTTKTKDSYEKILSAFANHEADILLGTQMIVKGHDFKNVTLVGVLAADLSLNAGDYRSAEKTFQLLAQASGRAGRGVLPGEVVIQTYQPEHYSVQAAATEDYAYFYEQEMKFRNLMEYPPVSHMLLVFCGSEKEDKAVACIKRIAELCGIFFSDRGSQDTKLIGPAPASIRKINDIFRYVLYIKKREYSELVLLKNHLEGFVLGEGRSYGCMIYFDFDPI